MWTDKLKETLREIIRKGGEGKEYAVVRNRGIRVGGEHLCMDEN